MRVLAVFCFSFAAGVFAAQYLLAERLLLFAALGCAVLGVLWALSIHGNNRRRAALIGAALALAFAYDWAYVRTVQAPVAALDGVNDTFILELTDYPAATQYGSRAEVLILGRGLRGRAIYYGDESLLTLTPGTRVSTAAEFRSAAVIRGRNVSTHVSRGVFSLLYGRGKAVVLEERAESVRYAPQRFARALSGVIDACFSERTRPFMKAILLGERFELSTEDATVLREAGLYHVTAVSGLHCAFLVTLLGLIVGRHHRRALLAVLVPVLAFYALMVGATPSVRRACVMLVLFLLAPLFRRESDGPTALSLALMMALVSNPYAAKSVSLHLSFAAMAGLIWVAPRFYARFGAMARSRAARFVFGSLAASAGAMVFTAPLSAVYFHMLPLIAPISNLLCLWGATLAFSAGLLAALAGLVWLPLGQVFVWAAQPGALYLLNAGRLLASLPYHALYFNNALLKYWLVYAYTLFAACAVAKRGRYRYVLASVLAVTTLAAALWFNAAPLRVGTLHVVALDVGQGQSAVLLSQGSAALVDCGSSSYEDAGAVTADYLLGAGIRRLDCVILSHYHEDHCNGLAALLSRLGVDRIVVPDIDPEDTRRAEVFALAERFGVALSFVRDTQRLPLGLAELTVFPPVGEGDMNEECLSVLCSAGAFDVLFTGDMDADSEYRLIASHPLPDVEVLVAGHHGSRYSTGGDLLAEVRPEAAVISCGAENRYGHPHRETLIRLARAGARIYRTDLQGNIHIIVD